MQAQTITETRSQTNMQELVARLNKMRSETEYCPVCQYPKDGCVCKQREQEAKRAEQLRVKREIERLGGVRAYEDFTAEKYTSKAVLEALKNYPAENYYLWGPAGSGKTHASVATGRKLPNFAVLRLSGMSREIRSLQDPMEQDSVIQKYATLPILIDDLLSEKITDFLNEVLFEIMDRRWQAKRGGLLMTSNKSIENIGAIIGDRTASRIVGLVGAKNTIELSGEDYRLKGAV